MIYIFQRCDGWEIRYHAYSKGLMYDLLSIMSVLFPSWQVYLLLRINIFVFIDTIMSNYIIKTRKCNIID